MNADQQPWFFDPPVALGDGPVDGHVPVLPVHVVGPGSGVIPQPDTKVLDTRTTSNICLLRIVI